MTNKPGVGAYRAPGAPHASFAIESPVDELVEKLGIDPLEVRLQNAIVEGDKWPDGNPWPRIGLKECLEALRDHPLWKNRQNLPPNEGVGVGAGGWPGGRGPAAAACRMDPGGKLTISVGAVDLTGQTTTFAMIAAEAFGLPADKVRVVISDTEAAPHSPGSGGSQITYTVGKAVLEAATEARKQALAIVAQELEAASRTSRSSARIAGQGRAGQEDDARRRRADEHEQVQAGLGQRRERAAGDRGGLCGPPRAPAGGPGDRGN